jgi:phosphatidylglycerol:prolipoprotein diacylglycerol transferase
MYPRLSDIFQDLFGFEFPIPIYSFGAMVALAVIMASWLTQKELDRLYAGGLIGGVPIRSDQGKKGRKKRLEEASPAVLVGTCTVLAVVGGFAGAKLFHILENLGAFFRDPGGMIFASGGFTFYGGLLVAAGAIAYYVRKKGLSVPRFADAVAPGLMIGYGIGRLGCHLSGDGDWGIDSNLAAKPGWLPGWFWAETYPNNYLNVTLENPVYPTPIYEFLACMLLFGILWTVRAHPYRAGWLFSLYLLLNGVERFMIEQIRVNNTFDVLGFAVTQAEVIAVALMLAGVVGLVLTTRRAQGAVPEAAPENQVVSTP